VESEATWSTQLRTMPLRHVSPVDVDRVHAKWRV
jgi:hypothetical protein